MKLLLPLIIILILIIFIIIIFNSNIYFSEDFTNMSSYEQNTIEDLISLSYVPKNPYEKEQISEYEIIDIYKKILQRSPSIEEIKYKVFYTKDELSEELYNSFEYDKMTKVQDNVADSGVESAVAKRNLIKKIIAIYKKKYNKEPVDGIINPLRDVYVHLRSNKYLFMAFINGDSYKKFENDVLTMITLTKKNLLEIFNKHYNLLELKIKAEEIIKSSKGSTATNEEVDLNMLKKELDKITKDNIPVSQSPVNKPIENVVKTDEISKYLNNEVFTNMKEGYTNSEDISSLFSNNQVLNILKDYVDKKMSNQEPVKTEPEPIVTKGGDDINKLTDGLPTDSEVYVRVYNPIPYKQMTYKGDDKKYRPPICTSLGQKSLEVPVFTESKLLFQGTELDKAFDDTQIGSIMPKFTYSEYQDIRIR